jgi:CRISPR-associated protein Csh1
MIKELIYFTKNIDDEFKNLGSKPKEGLHILLKVSDCKSDTIKIDTNNFEYEIFSKKAKIRTFKFLDKVQVPATKLLVY